MASEKTRVSLFIKFLGIIIVLGLSIVVSNVMIFNTFVKEFRIQSKAFSVYIPSVKYLQDLNQLNVKSVSYTKDWVFIDKDSLSLQKKELISIHQVEYPKFKQDFIWFVEQWEKDEQNAYFDLLSSMDSLVYKESIIMDKLSYFNDYNNPQTMFEIIPLISENGDIIRHSRRIEKSLENLNIIFSDKIEVISAVSADEFIKMKTLITWFSIIIIIILAFFSYFSYRNLIFVTNLINSVLEKTNQGMLPKVKKIRRTDEIGRVNINLRELITYLQDLSGFADNIGQNKFDTDFKLRSKGDVLGNALLSMRDNLVKAEKEANLRQKENTERNWASQGIADFNEVIRDNNNDMKALTNAVIEKLVNYTNSNIGGLFIVNEENEFDKYLELASFYAFDRLKFHKQKIKFGETLVGQCYVEEDIIYVTDVPDNYVYITSGLGSDKPKSILIVPLIFNEKIYGVVELASFSFFEDFQIDFVEKIGETIASAISTVKINQRTQTLLEESKEKSKRMEQQEVIAKQRIEKINKQLEQLEKENQIHIEHKENYLKQKEELEEKLTATIKSVKEENELEKKKYNSLILAINETIPFFQMDTSGEIIYANDLYIKQLNSTLKEVQNSTHSKYLNRDFINSGNYKQIWDKLKNGETVEVSVQYMIDGKNKYFGEKYIPFFDDDKKFSKVIVFGSM